jgi:hypothetical protein
MEYINTTGKKIAVIGSRSLTDKQLVYDFLDRNYDKIKMIVSGGATGADSMAQEWAKERGFPVLVFYPRWKERDGTHNKGAGFKRNRHIVEEADVVVAFWDGASKGTQNSLDTAKQLNKPVKIISFVPEPPPRVEESDLGPLGGPKAIPGPVEEPSLQPQVLPNPTAL